MVDLAFSNPTPVRNSRTTLHKKTKDIEGHSCDLEDVCCQPHEAFGWARSYLQMRVRTVREVLSGV